MEKLFPKDIMTKRERVEATLSHQSVDRAALLDNLSFNAGVIELYTGKKIEGFNYTLDDVCAVTRKTLDACFFPVPLRGTQRMENDGWVWQNDNWTIWLVKRPFNDETGAREWLLRELEGLRNAAFDPGQYRRHYRQKLMDVQDKIGETIIFDYPVGTGLCGVYGDSGMGIEIFTYFYDTNPEIMKEFMDVLIIRQLKRLHAIADEYRSFSPFVLIAEDFATKQGPIFPPKFLRELHYPYVRRLTEAWHEHGVKVMYHSDGNYRKAIPDLVKCGVDGFYCLEPACGMDVVELKRTWPKICWAGGVDGVDLLERGTPEQIRVEVHRHICETNALQSGGMFVASSSEINPPIKPANFKAMVDAVDELRNPEFY